MNHPPAMGGKTAWGVRELAATGLADDPEEIKKIKAAAADFQRREEERLRRLREMDGQAERIMADRHARRSTFDMTASTTNTDDFKRLQDEAMKKMREAKEARRAAKKQQKQKDGAPGKKKKKKSKKKKEDSVSSSSSSGSSSSSSESSSSSSSSGSKKKKKEKKAGKTKEKVLFEVRMDKLPHQDSEPAPAAQPAAPLDPELKRKAEEARLREKEVKRRAKEQAAAWAAEMKRKEAEAEAQRLADIKRKEEEAEAKRKADEEARTKSQEDAAEAKRKADEDAAKKAADAEERKKLFSASSGTKRDGKKSGIDRSKPVIGGYFEGQTVYAAKNITVRGNLVVKLGCSGVIIGPAENNPTQRIAVEFSKREDRLPGCLNVVPAEIKKTR